MKRLEWKTGSYNDTQVEEIRKELSLTSLAAKLLSARGFTSPALARSFLEHDIEKMHDPLGLCDMDRAVCRIQKAVHTHEKIAVYGDYDVDGITSTYILVDYLKSCGADCIYYIPDRMDEGYGVNTDAISQLSNLGVSLLITVDTGITAVAETEYARAHKMDIVVCDHHECKEILPDACAVVNPHRPDCGYPFKALAGVGVAFKLICALAGAVQMEYLPFVCIGTVADIMPLCDENRTIVFYGLQSIAETEHVGLDALISAAGVDKEKLRADNIGYALAPRINAAGRMSSATRVVELFMEESPARAKEIAEELCELNRTRQKLEMEIFQQALLQLPEVYNSARDHAIVLAGDGWHHGVIGIVASRLSERFQCPAILISLDGDLGKGSGRSAGDMNLYAALCEASDVLEQFGGHEMAVGLTVRRENISALRKQLNQYAAIALKDYTPFIKVDFLVQAEELTVCEIESLTVLEPFGTANRQPVLRLDDAQVISITPIGNGRHLKIVLEKNKTRIGCVCFGKTVKDIMFTQADFVDVVFQPSINDFRGRNVQLIVKDIRLCKSTLKKIDESFFTYERFLAGEPLSQQELGAIDLEYDQFAALWRYLKKKTDELRDGVLLPVMVRNINRNDDANLSVERILVALDVFSELSLMEYICKGIWIYIEMSPQVRKVDLKSSKIMRRIRAQMG